jgi:hypothetical protein
VLRLPYNDGFWSPHLDCLFVGRRVDVKSLLSQAQGKCISENRELYQAVMRMFNELENELKVCK